MATKVGGILIEMQANVARLQKDFDEAKRVVGRGAADIQRAMSTVKSALGGLGIGLGAGAIIGGFKALVDGLDDLADSAAGLQVTAVALSEMRMAARFVGADSETLATGLNRLNSIVSDAASGGKEAQGVFRALGVSFKDARGNARDTEEVLRDISDAFAGHADDATKAALANDLFGRSGYKLIPLLNQGADALRQNSGLTKEAVAEAQKLGAEFDQLAITWEKGKNALAGGLIPEVNALVQAMRDLKQVSDDKGFWATLWEDIQAGDPFRNSAGRIRQRRDEQRAAQAALGDLGGFDASMPGVRPGFTPPPKGAGTGTAARIEALPEAIAAAKEYEQTMRRLGQVVDDFNDLTFTQQEHLKILRGEYGPLTDLVRDEIMARARAADAMTEQTKAQKEISDARKQEEHDLAALNARLEEYAGITEDIRKQTETAALERQLAAGVVYTPEQLEKIVKGIARIGDEMKTTESAAEALGLQMVSALGDWIREPSGGWSSLFKALGKDVEQLIVQLFILKPLADEIRRILKPDGGGGGGGWGSVFGSIFSLFGGGGSTGGGSWGVVDTGALAGATSSGGMASKAGGTQINFAPSIRVDSRTDRAAVYADVDRAMRASEARLVDSMRRGGAMYQGA